MSGVISEVVLSQHWSDPDVHRLAGLSGDNGGSESEEGRRDNGFDKHDEE